jgi:hypothetical protein
LVIAVTVLMAIVCFHCLAGGIFTMKTMLIGIALAVGMVPATKAFASDVSDCPHIVWKHGHYVCVIEDNS